MVAPKKTTNKKPRTSKRKSTAKKSSTSDDQKKESCFVIMPFGGWFDGYYTSIFAPAIETAGLRPLRADDLYRPSTIVSDIWEYTREAKLILADLSGKNPNVFYELGLAHAIAKPAILVVESMDDIPFDLRALRILEYDKNDPNWGPLLQGKIEQAIKEVLAAPHLSVPAAFVEVKASRPTSLLTAHDKELLEIRQELDVLRRHTLSQRSRSDLHERSRSDLHERRTERVYMSPGEVRGAIQKYLEIGMPEDVIISQLEDSGAPLSFITSIIKENIGKSFGQRFSRRIRQQMDIAEADDAARSTKDVSPHRSSAKKKAKKKEASGQSNKKVATKKRGE